MPTFGSLQVSVHSTKLITTLGLEEIADLLRVRRPNTGSHTRGWTGISDDYPSGPMPAGTPTIEDIEVVGADDEHGFPERLAVRHYWWTKQKLNEDDAEPTWVLEAVDLIISAAAGALQLLWTSHDGDLTDPISGTAVASLREILKPHDANLEFSNTSVLSIEDQDVYLWMTDAADRSEPIDDNDDVTIKSVSGMNAAESEYRQSKRSGLLSGEIDLQRMSFLTAIATRAKLGPAVIIFAERDEDGREQRTGGQIWTDGTFKVRAGKSVYRGSILSPFELRLQATQYLAYRYIPLVQHAFRHDEEWGETRRERLIVSKQMFLATEYERLARANSEWAWYAEENDLEDAADLPALTSGHQPDSDASLGHDTDH